MSDATTAAPAAAPAATPSTPAAKDAAPVDPKAGAGAAAAATPPPEKPRFKAKVEGVEEEVDVDTLLATYQKNKAADKRLQEVTEEKKRLAEERRRAQEAKELGKKDPIRAIREFFEVEEVDSVLEQYLAEKYKAELLKEKDPRAYEMAMKEKALAEKEAALRQYEEQRAAEAYQQYQVAQAAEIRGNYSKALEALGVTTDEERAEAIEYMIDADLSALEYAATLPPEMQSRAVLSPEQLAQYAKERLGGFVSKAEAKFFKDLDSLDDDKFLEKLTPARVERLRKALIAKAKGAKAAAQQQPLVPPKQKVDDSAKPQKRQYMSDGEMLKRMLRGD